ncbi:MAG: MerR family DNA-binding transcriptional regulator [Pseudomonadota bacterium]
MTDQIMTIREMCDAFQVTPRTLRFYEAKELISPAREGQRRLYGRRDRARLKLILRGKQFGFSLEEIRQILNLYGVDDTGETQLYRFHELAQKRLQAMITEREQLDTAVEELRKEIAICEGRLNDIRRAQAAA